MVRLRLVLLLLYFRPVCCIRHNFYSQIVLDKDFEDIVTTCESKLCIRKCCGINEYVYDNMNRECKKINSSDYTNGTDSSAYTDGTDSDYIFLNLLNVPLYDNYYHDVKINKNLSDVFLLAPDKFSEMLEGDENIEFQMLAYSRKDFDYNFYLNEKLSTPTWTPRLMVPVSPNSKLLEAAYALHAGKKRLLILDRTDPNGGSLYLEDPNVYERWMQVNRSNYCIDINDEMIPEYWFIHNFVVFFNEKPGILTEHDKYHVPGLLISSVFLIIVLLVYMVLPELRNLAGLVLMAYVFSLASAFISLASLQLGDNETERCITWSGVTYFFLLSSFCWTSVMSYDIWCTFRGYAKPHVISNRREHFKFGMYCIYAWGVPILMTIGLMEINKMDLSAFPWIVKPQIHNKYRCFLQGGQTFVYLYIPMLILLISNWIFYIMTAFNIWILVRGSAILNSTHRSQKNRLMVYVKLSVIMGINWSLEVSGYLFPELKIWEYTDVYNLLIGFPIFLIFIWKQKIYRKLKTRFLNSPIPHKCYDNSMSSTLEL